MPWLPQTPLGPPASLDGQASIALGSKRIEPQELDALAWHDDPVGVVASGDDDDADNDDGCGALGSENQNHLEQRIADGLAQEAFHRGSTDNIAVIAVLLGSGKHVSPISSEDARPEAGAQECRCDASIESSASICEAGKGADHPAWPQCSDTAGHQDAASSVASDLAQALSQQLDRSSEVQVGGHPHSTYLYRLLSRLQKGEWHVHAQLMLPVILVTMKTKLLLAAPKPSQAYKQQVQHQ